jgi:WD40 repeat protein
VAFSPDGQFLASASCDNTVRLWDTITTGVSRGTLEGHSKRVWEVVFSPDGQLLASVSCDKTVRLWNATTGASCGTLEGHSEWVDSVAFSPDGRLLASASKDMTVRLWDIKTKVTIQQIYAKETNFEICFSSDGSYLETRQGVLAHGRHAHFEGPSQSNCSCLWGVGRGWVTWRTENILWLPPDYRPSRLSCVAVRHTILAMGLASGRVTFIEFDSDTNRLGKCFGSDLTMKDLTPMQHHISNEYDFMSHI